MKNLNRVSVGVLAITSLFALIGPITTYAATTPDLGAAATYGILSDTFNNTSATTIINGDIGFTTFAGLAPGGTNANFTPAAAAGAAQATALAALSAGANAACDVTFAAGAIDLGIDHSPQHVGTTYTPGVYCINGAMSIDTSPITFSGAGTYIFRSTGAFTTSAGMSVILVGASACDIFWNPNGLTSIGANNFFQGTVIPVLAAAHDITVLDATSWTGRALTFAHAVTIPNTNVTITVPTCTPPRLTLVKTITNDNGGARTIADFPLTAAGPITITGVSGAASITNAIVTAGTYTLSETTQTDYTASTYSCIKNGVTTAGNSISLIAGDVATCTIINNDKAPSLTLNKIVSGGTAIESAWTLTAAGPTTISGPGAAGSTDVVSGPTFSSGTYTLSESVGPSGYGASSWNCVKNGGVSVTGSSITLALNDVATCTITNTYTPPSGGGGSSILKIDTCPDGDYSYSYYDGVCGTAPIIGDRIIPLIGLLKVPTPLDLPAGSGSVTYNYVVWNVGGKQALTGITLTDDKCSSILFLSGDLNNNNKLDITEKWKYSCTDILSETTTNTAIASGYSDDAYHQLAVATAVATVVVGAPLTPPLINIVKVPSRLTPFPFGGGDVTYTYTVRNPGVVAMHDVVVTDDKCAPVSISIGDINHNNFLDTTETWVYTCQTHVPVSTMNTATAEGQANGFTAIAHAFAHVLVSNHVGSLSIIAPTSASKTIPSLPNTGLPPEDSIPWDTIILTSILIFVSALFMIVQRKRSI